MTPLGKLKTLHDRIVTNPDIHVHARGLIANIMKRMALIDVTVSTSQYRELKPGEQDEVPTGDHYNELWDAIQDEICGLEQIVTKPALPDLKVCWLFADLAFPITLEQNKSTLLFTVSYGSSVKLRLPYDKAATELGCCIMHALACDGRLNAS